MTSNYNPEPTQKSLLDNAASSPSENVDPAGPLQDANVPATSASDLPDVESAVGKNDAALKGENESMRAVDDTAQGEALQATKRRGGKKKQTKGDGPAEGKPASDLILPSPPPIRRVPGKKLYQDEIYGTKELSPLAVAIIDAPEFQRLGHIYQLGFTYQSFRGANHRRFDHSVGTFFRVRTLLRRVVQNHARLFSSNEEQFRHPGCWLSPQLYIAAPGTRRKEQSPKSSMGRWRGLVEIVSAAALLHDLGHVPAGHTLEDEFNIIGKHDGMGGARFFQMFYGPRTAKKQIEGSAGPPSIENYFYPINEELLPRPAEWERATLPWIFEDGVYDRFLLRDPNKPESGLANSHIRDLIYLILSFKDKILVNEHQTAYTTFRDFIETELEGATNALRACSDDEERTHSLNKLRRVEFIQALYHYYSRPLDADDESKPIYYPFMSDVVGNTICADLLDYLVRDGKRLKLDTRDNPRLERYLVIRPDESFVSAAPYAESNIQGPSNLRLTIYAVHATPGQLPRRDTVSDLLDLMRERYRFAEIVYYHPKKAAFSAMLAKAMELLPKTLPIDECPQDDEHIYPAPWSGTRVTKPSQLAHFGDEGLIQYLAGKSDRVPQLKDLCDGITYRSEYRLLYTLDYDTALKSGGATKFTHDLKNQGGAAGHREHREDELTAILSRCGLWNADDAPPILIYCPSLRMQAKEVEARVELEPGCAMSLNRHEALRDELRMMNEKYQRLWRLYLFVHPRLHARLDEFSQGSIVDAFCNLYSIPIGLRGRGCRIKYQSLSERVDSIYRDWIDQRDLGGWPRETLRFVKDSAIDARFWQDRLGTGLKGHPVTREEYFDGFLHLAQISGADFANARAREQWPEPLREMRGLGWYCVADVTRAERARALARDQFKKLVEASHHQAIAASNPPEERDWEEFSNHVGAVLRAIRL